MTPRAETLTPADRARLAGILGRLGSDFEAERATAGRMASDFLRDRGMTWAELIDRPAPTPPPLNLLIPYVRQDVCQGPPRWHRAPLHRHQAGQPRYIYQVRPDDLAGVAFDGRLHQIPVV